MNTTIQTGLYRLQDLSVDWGVAHLYEHLLIRSFHKHVERSGYSPYLFGWVSGETFQGMIFIEYGFYNPAITKLFSNFMRQTSRIDYTMVNKEILRMEAEDSVLIHADIDQIKILLKKIDSMQFTNVEASSGIEQIKELTNSRSVLSEKRSKESFRQVTIAVGLPSASLEEKAVFTRLTPILFDALNTSFFSLGMYENEASWPVYNRPHDAMLAHAIYTIKNDTATNELIKTTARKALKNIHLKNHQKELQLYASGFAHTPNWHTFPIDYFRYSGLVVSRASIATLLTTDNIERLLALLKVDVLATTQEHYDVVK